RASAPTPTQQNHYDDAERDNTCHEFEPLQAFGGGHDLTIRGHAPEAAFIVIERVSHGETTLPDDWRRRAQPGRVEAAIALRPWPAQAYQWPRSGPANRLVG